MRRARTPYVAFSDDDSWWAPGALTRAVSLLDSHPQVGLVAGATLVGPEDAPDPLNAVLAASPLARGALPGPRLLGFLGCAAVARREAFLAAGGYSRSLFIGGEEELLACDLAARSWPVVYADDVVAHHWPSPVRDARRRRCQELRNRVLVAWLRRPLPQAAAATASLVRAAAWDAVARRALTEAAVRLPAAVIRRRRLPPAVEADIRLLAACPSQPSQPEAMPPHDASLSVTAPGLLFLPGPARRGDLGAGILGAGGTVTASCAVHRANGLAGQVTEQLKRPHVPAGRAPRVPPVGRDHADQPPAGVGQRG